jgi:hypothetical protein
MTAIQNIAIAAISLFLNKNKMHLNRCVFEFSTQLLAVKQTQYQWREQLTFFLVFDDKML